MTNTNRHQKPVEASPAEKAADEAKSLRDDARAKAAEMRDTASRAARDTANEAKAGVAKEISNMGSALRRASEELRDGSPQERTFGYMASTLADLSDTVRDKDLGEMVDDLSRFARRNPVAFLGGAALLGFAGVRMAKASARRDNTPENWESTYPDHIATEPKAGRSAAEARSAAAPHNLRDEP